MECSNGQASKAAGEKKSEAYPLGYVEEFFEPRTKLDVGFTIPPLHVAVFAQQLHPSSLILCAPGALGDGGVTQFFNDVVDRLRRGFNGEGARRAAEASIACAVSLIEIQIHKRNVFVLDVFPNIDLRPVE